jgi:hypothetical protein
MTKIIPRIFGGIGNQLFIYAAARRLALVNNAELVLDDVSGFVRDHVYQRQYQLDHFNISCRKATPSERLEPFDRIRRYLKRSINKRFRSFKNRSFIEREGIDFDPRLLSVKPKGCIYLEGTWQSENYFKDVEPTIRQDLQIQPPTDIVNQTMAEKICSHTAVAIHVRFFDEPQDKGINNAPRDYYQHATAEMERRVSDAHYYLFSDRPEAALRQIPIPETRITTVNHNFGDDLAYADLWLMAQCRHFIIANSTFSWWGAWLSRSDKKTIIAPGFEKRDGCSFWGFRGLIPENWIKV